MLTFITRMRVQMNLQTTRPIEPLVAVRAAMFLLLRPAVSPRARYARWETRSWEIRRDALLNSRRMSRWDRQGLSVLLSVGRLWVLVPIRVTLMLAVMFLRVRVRATVVVRVFRVRLDR